MTLDSHRHFWHYNTDEFGWIAEDALKRDFLHEDAAAFDPCVAIEARQSEEETKWLIKLAKANPAIRGVVGWLDIASGDFPSILDEYAEEEKLVGLRHVVQDEPDDAFILRKDFVRGVKHLLREGFTYDILVFERQLENATRFVDELPCDGRLVLDHMGKPADFATWQKRIRSLGRRENVYCKLSGLVTETGRVDFTPYLDTVLQAFGAKRVMFGSDWPVVSAHMPYPEWKDTVEDYISQFSADERNAIMCANAERFYLKPQTRSMTK